MVATPPLDALVPTEEFTMRQARRRPDEAATTGVGECGGHASTNDHLLQHTQHARLRLRLRPVSCSTEQVEAILLMLVSAGVGAAITIGVQRVQATWLKRRDTAAEAYAAAVAVHSAVLSSLALARRIAAELRERPHDVQAIARSSDWNVTAQVDASKERLNQLREARLNIQAIWGSEVGTLFDDYFELTRAWNNAFGTYHDAISGVDFPDEIEWDPDMTAFNWDSVIASTTPHDEAFGRELKQLMNLIQRFARSAGAPVIDSVELPQGVREVVGDYEEHKARKSIAVKSRAALPPPK